MKKILGISFVVFGFLLIGMFYLLIQGYSTINMASDSERIIVGVAGLLLIVCTLLFFIFPFILLVGVLGGLISFSKRGAKSVSGERRPIIYQVPSNHVWVIRAAIGSKPGNPLYSIYDEPNILEKLLSEGKTEDEARSIVADIENDHWYWPQTEGYKPWIPGLFIDEGVYNLEPKQRDIMKIKVPTRDGLTVLIDLQLTTFIKNAVRFAISMEGDTVEEKEKSRIRNEDQLLHTATTSACSCYNSEELQALVCRIYKADKSEETRKKYWMILTTVYPEKKEKDTFGNIISSYIDIEGKKITEEDKDMEEFWELAKNKFNIRKDGEEKEFIEAPIPMGTIIKEGMKKLFIGQIYGIFIGQIGIKSVYTPDDVREALEDERSSIIEKRTAKNKGETLKQKIDLSGADPTKAYIVDSIADVLRPLVGKIGPAFRTSEDRKEKKNEGKK